MVNRDMILRPETMSRKPTRNWVFQRVVDARDYAADIGLRVAGR